VREREVESHLGDAVEKLGGKCVKFVPDLMPGMPDRIIVLPRGVLVWCELKKPKGGKLSSLQKLRHKWLRSMGQEVFVVWTKEQADDLCRELADRLKN
jgi:hypothetical protein